MSAVKVFEMETWIGKWRLQGYKELIDVQLLVTEEIQP